jgi:uracil-DNA glycosylase
MDDADRLREMIKAVPHPSGIAPAMMGIPGPAFFPGGTGVLANADNAGRTLPKGGAMVVGHNFGTVKDYETAILRGHEHLDSMTWRILLPFLRACRIEPLACFFTNALLGLLVDGSSTGSRPGHRDPRFRIDCARVLQASIALQRPSLILVCGLPAAKFLGEMTPDLAPWSSIRSFADLDEGGPVRRFGGVPTVAITHPSYRPVNVRHRRFAGLIGHEAELAMVRSSTESY